MRTVLKSNSAFVAIGGTGSSWTTGQDVCRIMSLIQGVDFSVNSDRQKLKGVGSDEYVFNGLVRNPDVEVKLGYLLSPSFNNELLLGIGGSGDYYSSFLSRGENYSSNLYVVMDDEQANSAANSVTGSGVNFDQYKVIGFGNCYMNSYDVSFALNSVPTVNVAFSASNMQANSPISGKVPIPSINEQSGNAVGAGFFDLGKFYTTAASGFVSGSRSEFNAPIASPNEGNFALSKLEIGGVDVTTTPIIQSITISAALERENLYGFGSNYPYGRKLNFPSNGTIQTTMLVSGVTTGEMNNLLIKDSGCNIDIAFWDQFRTTTGYIRVEDAKVDNYSYSMRVNGVMEYQVGMSFQITRDKGIFTKRTDFNGYAPMNEEQSLWKDINVTWNS